MSATSNSFTGAERWALFCAVVDNFGDMGVCWRLARQLVDEHGIDVDLWVDDWPAMGRFLAAQDVGLVWPANDDSAAVKGVTVLHWRKPWPDSKSLIQRIADSDRIIEAFGCELPDPVKHAMAGRQTPLLWFNLEYLSAEPWVRGCHGLPSPQNLSPMLRKYFFFPGFESDTGGLLRETGLLEQHQRWQAAGRRHMLRSIGLDAVAQQNFGLVVSVFSYQTGSLAGWLQTLADGEESVLCLVPEGRSLSSVTHFLEQECTVEELAAGAVHRRGSLTIAVLPFRSQSEYDHLLSLCDFNVVRGEDSFVRAQWAAKPLMWHIYPQDDGIHIQKLKAFAGLYLAELRPETKDAWLSFALSWNLGEDCGNLWHYLRPQLPDLHAHARKWQQKLSDLPDLATNLVFFDRQNTADKQSTP